MKAHPRGSGLAAGLAVGILFYMLMHDIMWAAALGGGVAIALELRVGKGKE